MEDTSRASLFFSTVLLQSDVVKSFPEYYDRDATQLIMRGEDFFDFPSLEITMTREESKTINTAKPPKIIIAGSGMMNGGRILHHLVRYLGKRGNTLFIVGFQAAGTLGRRLYTGERRVEILGEMVNVKADVISCGGYSAHGDQHKLINWIRGAKSLPRIQFMSLC
jgi:metallo-beta-lactamase family protein